MVGGVGVNIGAIWRILLSNLCAAAMRTVTTITVANRKLVRLIYPDKMSPQSRPIPVGADAHQCSQ